MIIVRIHVKKAFLLFLAAAVLAKGGQGLGR